METSDSLPAVQTATKRSRLRFGQFTLKSLLILMALVGAYFGGRVSMLPQLEAERTKAREASQKAEVAAQQHAGLLRQRFLIRYQPMPMRRPLEITEGIERAERVNLQQHQQRYQQILYPPQAMPVDRPPPGFGPR